jgi:hypothetical protein
LPFVLRTERSSVLALRLKPKGSAPSEAR